MVLKEAIILLLVEEVNRWSFISNHNRHVTVTHIIIKVTCYAKSTFIRC